jgi:outer membrane protein TolC
MNEKALLLLLVLVWPFAGPAAERDAAPAKPDLLSAHLSQVRELAPSSKQPGADAALEKLKAEIAAKRQAWEQKEAPGAGVRDLLAGLPAAVREKALAAAGDEARTKAALKAGVDLELLLALTAFRSPEAQAAHEKWRAVLRRFDQASYLEDLVTQYRAFVRELDTLVGPQTHKEMAEMTFPFPAALTLKGQIVDAEANLAWLGYQGVLRGKLHETARAFFEVQYAAHAAEIVRDSRVLFTQMAESAEARLRAGQGDQAYLLMTQSEVAMLDTRLTTLERRRANALAQANALLGLPPAAEWGAVAPRDLAIPAWTLEEALKVASAENQDLHMARQEVTLMELMVRMAETEVLPRGSAGYSQQALSMGADAGPTRSMMASFPEKQAVDAGRAGFGANAAYLDELRVRVQEVRRKLAAMQAQTEFMVKDGHFRLDAARREQRTRAETVVPKAEQAYEVLRARYAAGAAPLRDFLEAGRASLDRRLELEGARREQNVMASELLSAAGRSAAGARSERREERGP